MRKIRIDFNSSGRSTPRAVGTIEANLDAAFPRGVLAEDRFPPSEKDRARARIEARRLEDKVARAAAKKCSVEEVAMLQSEVDNWLRDSDPTEEQVSTSPSVGPLPAVREYRSLTSFIHSFEANLPRAQLRTASRHFGQLPCPGGR